MAGVMVSVSNVSKSFNGTKVLEGVSLEVREGEVHSVLGPNGVGKTTLLKIIAGILRPDSGHVSVKGKVSYVPQGDSLLPWRTVVRNVTLPLELAGVGTEEAIKAASKVAEELKIERYLYMYPREVSGGTRRKAAIARALVSDPDVLLLDEPYAGLDIYSVRSTNEALLGLADRGKAIIVVSHQIDEAAEVSSVTTIISGKPGKVAATANVRGLEINERVRVLRELASVARWE
ncbi:MAG: ABC transporter ATP-binding protein [Acidilobus sp.]